MLVLSLGLGGMRNGGVDALERPSTPARPTLETDRTNSPGGLWMGTMALLKCSFIASSILKYNISSCS
eukprot:12929962-Prorocentrum_lima.AAC.1